MLTQASRTNSVGCVGRKGARWPRVAARVGALALHEPRTQPLGARTGSHGGEGLGDDES